MNLTCRFKMRVWMWPVLLVVFFSCCCCSHSNAESSSDRIESLPQFGIPPVPMYSGYLNATDGCHPWNGYCKIHYWLSMAKNTHEEEEEEEDCSGGGGASDGDCHSKKPLVLWLNGGT